MTARRCRSVYPGAATLNGRDIRCDGTAGHPERHGNSFAARYWDEERLEMDEGVVIVTRDPVTGAVVDQRTEWYGGFQP